MKKWEKFMAEYDALCEKYGYQLNSCGCCESPWLEPRSKDESPASHVVNTYEYIDRETAE